MVVDTSTGTFLFQAALLVSRMVSKAAETEQQKARIFVAIDDEANRQY
jgi:hypothetical protein